MNVLYDLDIGTPLLKMCTWIFRFKQIFIHLIPYNFYTWNRWLVQGKLFVNVRLSNRKHPQTFDPSMEKTETKETKGNKSERQLSFDGWSELEPLAKHVDIKAAHVYWSVPRHIHTIKCQMERHYTLDNNTRRFVHYTTSIRFHRIILSILIKQY